MARECNDETDAESITVTLTDDQWAQVLHAIVVCQGTNMRMPELGAIGRAIADAAPKGSATWFGRALLERS